MNKSNKSFDRIISKRRYSRGQPAGPHLQSRPLNTEVSSLAEHILSILSALVTRRRTGSGGRILRQGMASIRQD
jgi:hypothetical protein